MELYRMLISESPKPLDGWICLDWFGGVGQGGCSSLWVCFVSGWPLKFQKDAQSFSSVRSGEILKNRILQSFWFTTGTIVPKDPKAHWTISFLRL